MRNRTLMRRTAFAGACCLHAATLLAQQSSATVDDFRTIASKITTESKVFPLVRDGGNQSNQASPEPLLSFLASNDGVVAKARFGYLVSDVIAFDGTVAGPVRSGTATFADKTGIANGVTFEGDMTIVLSRKTSSRSLPAGAPLATAAERGAMTPPQRRESLSPSAALGREQVIQRFGLARADGVPPSLDDLVTAAMRIGAVIQSEGGVALTRSGGGPLRTILGSPAADLAAQATPAELASVLNSRLGHEAFAAAFRLLANDLNLWKVDRAWLLTLAGTAGRPVFTVADTAALKFQPISKHTSGGSIALGTVITRSKENGSQGFYFGGSYEKSTSFGASVKNTCLPSGSGGALICQNATGSEPSPLTEQIFQGDARFYFNNLSVAISARPSYEKESRETTVAFPIYFLHNSKDLQSALTGDKAGLNGGVNFGWRKSPGNRADFFAVFFVSSLFNLPGVPH